MVGCRAASGQRVAALPPIKYTVPAWSRPVDPGRRFTPGPASRRAPRDQAHCARLVDHHQPASRRAPSDQAHCACLVARTSRFRQVDHPGPVVRGVPSDQAQCARLVSTSGSEPEVQPLHGESLRSQRSSTLFTPCGAHVEYTSGDCRRARPLRSLSEAERGVEDVAVVLGSSLRVTACPYPLPSPTSLSPKATRLS
jgi:hypothetical protein